MPNQYSITQIRDRFAQIVRQVEKGKPIQVLRQGKPVAIILSMGEYQRLLSENVGFGASLGEFRQKYQVQTLDINPDEVFQNVRDRSFGREVSF